MAQTKYFIVNNDNWEKTLPELGIKIPAKWKTMISPDLVQRLSRQFEIEEISIDKVEEKSIVEEEPTKVKRAKK